MFFDDIWSGVRDFGSSIGSGIKDVSVGAYNSVFKPVGEFSYNEVIKPVANFAYNDVAKPVGNFVENTGGKLLDKGERLLDSSLNTFDNISNLLTNPIVVIGILIVGGIVVTKLLDNPEIAAKAF